MPTLDPRDVPNDEIPATPQLEVDLVDTPELQIWLDRVWVYSTGFSFHLNALSTAKLPSRQLFDAYTYGEDPLGFLLVVTFADGRVATNYRDFRSPPGDPQAAAVQLINGPGFFVSPLPPPGPLKIVVALPVLGVDERVATIDGTIITDVAGQVSRVY